MRAIAASWSQVRPNALGRAHIAMQCVASKAVYGFLTPSSIPRIAMQAAINRFVASSQLPEEETPYGTALFPRFSVAAAAH
eukprot:280910-Chlamydomonas_euryale.AAC.2